MIPNIFKTRTILAVASIGLISLITLSFTGINSAQKRSDLYRLNSGIDICFQRISQSFTALMIRDLSSQYLSADFHSVTGDCFNEVSRSLTEMGVSKSILANVNNLKSDFYWFGQKVGKIKGMLAESDLDMTKSNITQKYYELDSMKSEIEDKISSLGSDYASSISLTKWASLASILVLFMASIALVLRKRFIDLNEKKILTQLENSLEHDYDTKSRLLDQIFEANLSAQTSSYIVSMFKNLEAQLAQTQQMLLKSNSLDSETVYSINENIDEIPVIDNKVDIDELLTTATSDFSREEELEEGEELDLILLTAVESLKPKMEAARIEVDMNFNETMYVRGLEENIQQFLYTLMNHLVSSVENDNERVLHLKSRALGGLVYCQFELEDHFVSSDEIAILKGKEPSEDTAVGLILLKELLQDIGAGISIDNKFDSKSAKYTTLIDIIFDKAKAKTNEKSATQIVKGNKAEIRKYLDNQLGLA